MKYIMGIDIGGTKIECALLKITKGDQNTETSPKSFNISTVHEEDYHGQILIKERAPTDRLRGYQPVLKTIHDLIMLVCQKSDVNLSKLEGIGIGLPGAVDPKSQCMLNGNTAIFINKDIRADLETILAHKTKMTCENDASLFAFAETLCGAGQQYYKESGTHISQQTCIGIILGTGVGGGIVFKGQILQGRNGGGGELGHTELQAHGHPCYCGRNGCVEQYLSGPGIEAQFASRMYSQIKNHPSAKEIFELAHAHDPVATAIVKQYKKHLTKFMVNLTNVFDPDYLVLGGGVSNQDIIYKELETRIAREAFIPNSKPKVYKNKLGDSSGVIGAAMLVLE